MWISGESIWWTAFWHEEKPFLHISALRGVKEIKSVWTDEAVIMWKKEFDLPRKWEVWAQASCKVQTKKPKHLFYAPANWIAS